MRHGVQLKHKIYCTDFVVKKICSRVEPGVKIDKWWQYREFLRRQHYSHNNNRLIASFKTTRASRYQNVQPLWWI